MKKLIVVIFLSLILSGCTTYRPQYDADYEKAVSAVIDKSSETIKFNDHAYWYPNRSVMEYTFSTIEGNLLVTNKTLYFLQWDTEANSYNVVKKIPISNIKNAKIVSYGINKFASIQSAGDHFDIFTFVYDVAGIKSDQNKEMSEYINSLIKKSPVTPERH